MGGVYRVIEGEHHMLQGVKIKLSCFTSLIGEVLVLHELLKRCLKATWKGRYGFDSYDIMINDKKRIEVNSVKINSACLRKATMEEGYVQLHIQVPRRLYALLLKAIGRSAYINVSEWLREKIRETVFEDGSNF